MGMQQNKKNTISKKEIVKRLWKNRKAIIGIIVEEALISVGILRKPTQWLEDSDGHLIMTIK